MIHNLAKLFIFSILKNIHFGTITLIDNNEEKTFESHANKSGNNEEHDLQCTITVNNQNFYKQLLVNGSLGAGDSYINGDWQVDNLTKLIRIIVLNKNVLSKMDSFFSKLKSIAGKAKHRFRKNTIIGSKKNIMAHYDLGNDFFELFLDSSLMYSSAIFSNNSKSLEYAANYKLQYICDKLNLKETDHVLEIGTGWGGLAIYIAEKIGCKVTTTTISEQQYHYVRKKIDTLNLSHKITLIKKDYRDLTGKFDKIVSIEMLEAVGYEYYHCYFKQCSDLLLPGGQALIQVITITDQEYERAKHEVDFIKQYIFPGGCLPSLTVICTSLTQHTDLRVVHAEDIGIHYAQTLLAWRERFNQRLNEVKELGFDEKFIRMWNYYLCYCEAGFLEKYISDFQLVLIKPHGITVN